MTIDVFLQHLANAISLGSLYALIAIGYTLVYGILRLINFAHGDLIMVAAYAGFYGIMLFKIPWWLAFPLAVLMTALMGVVIEKAAYKPIRSSPRISLLISAIAVSFFLENLAIVVFSGRPKAFPQPEVLTTMLEFGPVFIMSLTFIIPLVTLVLLLVLNFLVNKTTTGMAMRAVAKDFETSSLMGVEINRIVSYTFALGSALAAVGGIMWALKFPQIQPLMGIFPGLKCFIAAVVGGIGSITGATIGGFLLGLIEIMLVAFLPELTGYRDAFAFILLIIILIFRPTGIVGEKIAEKV